MKFSDPRALMTLWALVPLVLLVFLAGRARGRAAARFAESRLWEAIAPDRSVDRRRWKIALRVGAVAMIVIALAGPEWGARVESIRRRGVDVVVLLDTSLSMQARDLPPSRLAHARREIEEFLDHLHGDRVALVPFAGTPVLSCPLTMDYGAARMLLDAAGPTSSPRPGTAIARAIRLGLKVFAGQEKKYKVMVLLTDGEDQEGDVEGAAKAAAEEGVIIHTVGLGSTQGDIIPLEGTGADAEGGFKHDRSGQVVVSRLGEETLQEIARTTHGTYRRATPAGGELEAVYSQIENMEKREFEGQNYVRYQPRFQWPVVIAWLLLLVDLALPERRWRRQHA